MKDSKAVQRTDSLILQICFLFHLPSVFQPLEPEPLRLCISLQFGNKVLQTSGHSFWLQWTYHSFRDQIWRSFPPIPKHDVAHNCHLIPQRTRLTPSSVCLCCLHQLFLIRSQNPSSPLVCAHVVACPCALVWILSVVSSGTTLKLFAGNVHLYFSLMGSHLRDFLETQALISIGPDVYWHLHWTVSSTHIILFLPTVLYTLHHFIC